MSGPISGTYISLKVTTILDVYANITADGFGYGAAQGPGAPTDYAGRMYCACSCGINDAFVEGVRQIIDFNKFICGRARVDEKKHKRGTKY